MNVHERLMQILADDLCDSTNGNGECCDCAELRIRGKRVPPPTGHDCEYVRQRSALVAQAARIANARVAVRSPQEDGGKSYATWTKVFAQAVDDLARPLLNGSEQPDQRLTASPC